MEQFGGMRFLFTGVPDWAFVAAHAILRRMSQKDEATIVSQEYFNAGCCDVRNLRNLSASFARL